MKLTLSGFFLIFQATQFIIAQNHDSLRQVIRSMNFDLPVLTPVPSTVSGVNEVSISLNGTWKFNPDKESQSRMGEIEVPGEWEMQGYHVEKGKSAIYRRSFILPSDWEGKRVRRRFDGVRSYGLIRVNGKTIGSHEGSFAAFEFDITKEIVPGENLLEVEVQCETVSDLLACTSQYAAHPVGGILRKVTLYTLPQINISDFFWNVEFDDQYRDAAVNFTCIVGFDAKTRKRTKAFLKFDIQDSDGTPLSYDRNTFEIPVNRSFSELKASIKVLNPAKWDPEHPNLYLLTVSQVSDDKVVQVNKHKLGFRQIELRGNQFFVNNHPVKLRGVNRHEIHPLRGRSLTPDLCRRDVELFRNGNCNYIRTSHYPPSEEFLQACDELGMFVESEASLCWIQHGASPIWQTWNYLDTQYLPYMVRANQDNVLAGRDHCCIIIWSAGNESRWSPLWERVLEEVKKLDPSRSIAFHDQCWGAFNNDSSRADIANYHYPGFNGPGECEKEKNRPTLFGEYMHVQCYARRELETDPGVRSDVWANTLKQMVDSVYKYPACLGGAIWSGIDDIFHLSETRICGYGPWGPIDGWRRKKPEYIGMKNSYTPVKIINPDSVKVWDNKLILNIENRYNFTNLGELKTVVKVGDNTYTVNAELPPLSKGSLMIDLPENFHGENFMISFTDPRGFVCMEEVIRTGIHSASDEPLPVLKLSLKEDEKDFIIESGNNIFRFDKKEGELHCSSSGKEVIATGGKFMLVYFNNDDGGAPNIANNGYTQDIKPLEYEPPENYRTESVTAVRGNDGAIILMISGRAGEKLEGQQEYKFSADGSVEVSYDYLTLIDFKGRERLRQYGILFTLPGSFDSLSWKRKGLWSVYPDFDINRLEGSATASPRDLKYVEMPREIPSVLWKESANRLGSNDFRSTKDNIVRVSLKSDNNIELKAGSDGSQSARAWGDGDKIRFLVAGMNGPGSCGFFTGPRPEFSKGEHLKGKFTLNIK